MASPQPLDGEAQSKRIVQYKLSARLDAEKKQIAGRERLTWLNDSTDRIGELQFHLYLNAFKNLKSTFMRESGIGPGHELLDTFTWGWIDIASMKIVGGEDLTAKIEFIHPDDDNADDQTVIRVPLSAPVAPSESITLDIEFLSQLPRVFARTGYWGDFFMVVQWFPKIGVYEAIGERGRTTAGWNCHQYHATSEYYADFGMYDVEITLPSRFRIGATGKLGAKKENSDGTTTYDYSQADVHDFAWTASPDFLVVTDKFSEPGLKAVDITLLLQPEHAEQKDRHLRVIRNAIKYHGQFYGVYPYDTLTVVDPPYNADAAGGMEYPTLITAGTAHILPDDEFISPEFVTVHEFGHQYWYGLCANNEFEESWLDEGINSYTEWQVFEAAYPPTQRGWLRYAGVPLFRIPVDLTHAVFNRFQTLSEPAFERDPIMTAAWKFYDRNSYGLNSYPRPALTLKTLENHLGQDVMRRIMRTYFERWRFRHPTSRDFFDIVNEVSGRDMNWFFDEFFYGTHALDYAVAGLTSREKSAQPPGVYDRDRQKVEVKREGVSSGARVYESEVTVQRLGEAVFPVEVFVRFENGEAVRESWDGRERYKRFKYERATKVLSAEIDPERKVLLDINLINNSRTLQPSNVGPMSLASRALVVIQHLLQVLASVG